jgi:steroid delta-isomerase-like uncharacterized protein
MSDLLSKALDHYDAMARGDLEAAALHFADDVETTSPQGTLKGIEEFKAMGRAFLTAVPDQRMEVIRSFEVGDTVIIEGVYSGTQTGPLVGPQGAIPASGNAFAFPFADLLTFDGEKCVRHHIYWDNVTFLAQLGVMPS